MNRFFAVIAVFCLSFGAFAMNAHSSGFFCDCVESDHGGGDWDGAIMSCESGNSVRRLIAGGSSKESCLNDLKGELACPGTCQGDFYCDCVEANWGGGDWEGAIMSRESGNVIRRLPQTGSSKSSCMQYLKRERACR